MSNRHSDTVKFLEQPEEAAPFLKGLLIALIPALLCWAGIIEVALKFWLAIFALIWPPAGVGFNPDVLRSTTSKSAVGAGSVLSSSRLAAFRTT
jgi:hypothetical protein